MKDLSIKIRRQAEFLGMILGNSGKYTISDLAELLGIDEITIKRDMRDLRSLGIDIHSKGKSGISVCSEITMNQIYEILMQYLGIAVFSKSYDRATIFLINSLGGKSLHFLTTIQTCIDRNLFAYIDYRKSNNTKESLRRIEPLLMFNSERDWRLMAMQDGKVKQFLISRIFNVIPTNLHFKSEPKLTQEKMFTNSFGSWISDEQYHIKLKIDQVWTEKLSGKIIFENQKIISNDDGTSFVEGDVNVLSEISAWIVTRGYGITVIEPEELKYIVIELANGVIENYDKK